MEHQLTPALQSTPNNLSQLIAVLVNSVLPTAVRRKSFIVNDIPRELYIAGNENILAAVLSTLLNTVVSHTEDCCIRISAKTYGGITLVYMKDSGSFNKYTVAYQLQELQLLAKKVGGCISVINRITEAPSIAFSFPHMAKAA